MTTKVGRYASVMWALNRAQWYQSWLCLPKIPSQWRKHRINNIQVQQVAEVYSPNQACNIATSAARGHFLRGWSFRQAQVLANDKQSKIENTIRR